MTSNPLHRTLTAITAANAAAFLTAWREYVTNHEAA